MLRLRRHLLASLVLGLWVAQGCAVDPCEPGQPCVVFPDDHAPHSEQMEWWYYTGRLHATGRPDEVYGFELTVFQPRVLKKFIYVSHFTITDLKRQRFDLEMLVTPDDQRQVAPPGQFKLRAGQSTVEGQGARHVIHGAMKSHTLDLTLAARTPPILQYGSGWMTVGSSAPFYYYSYPRMTADGTLTPAGGAPIAVEGRVWMDHQWGTIGNGYGWDWFSVRLDDETDLMVFKVRHDDGTPGFLGGTLIKKDGSTVALKDGEIDIKALGSWKSPHNAITYSHGWKIDVPRLGLSAEVTPLLADQEFHLSAGSPIYWEGLCGVKATREGKTLGGHAYVEITGFVPKL